MPGKTKGLLCPSCSSGTSGRVSLSPWFRWTRSFCVLCTVLTSVVCVTSDSEESATSSQTRKFRGTEQSLSEEETEERHLTTDGGGLPWLQGASGGMGGLFGGRSVFSPPSPPLPSFQGGDVEGGSEDIEQNEVNEVDSPIDGPYGLFSSSQSSSSASSPDSTETEDTQTEEQEREQSSEPSPSASPTDEGANASSSAEIDTAFEDLDEQAASSLTDSALRSRSGVEELAESQAQNRTSQMTLSEIVRGFEGLQLMSALIDMEPDFREILELRGKEMTLLAPADGAFKVLPEDALERIAQNKQYRQSGGSEDIEQNEVNEVDSPIDGPYGLFSSSQSSSSASSPDSTETEDTQTEEQEREQSSEPSPSASPTDEGANASSSAEIDTAFEDLDEQAASSLTDSALRSRSGVEELAESQAQNRTSQMTLSEIVRGFEGLQLMSALIDMEPDFREILELRGKEMTLLAPADGAFKVLPEDALERIAQNKQYRQSVLAGLLIPGALFSTALSLEAPTLVETATWRYVSAAASPFGQMVIDKGATVLLRDVVGGNGVLQVTDSCLLMPTIKTEDPLIPRPLPFRADLPIGTLVQTIPSLSVLGEIMDGKPLTFFNRLNLRMTLFAPVDAAFLFLGPQTSERLRKDYSLGEIFRYHIFPGVLDLSVIPKERYVAAQTLHNKGKSRFAVVKSPWGEVSLNDYSSVVVANIKASNGMLHLVDALLVPPSPEPKLKKNATEMTRAGSESQERGGDTSSLEGVSSSQQRSEKSSSLLGSFFSVFR
uniref:FAS1 domain-containing protein n=1 Tax=Chromera velia CCMP2878 TaxID=1169474 RepID=A0A0G4GYZ0_9ALVE|eukprot:Cvel_23968.t1-p1 / transcript=Cvel_23968.t1 / gene=Cvel_23968 / organism=Chromera_velia_CCMP2878 / gene_product=hypothetical protein / transcript_product=hypothetical protein / location=Cvel_scaffold2536:522-5452(-) / protein_length=774 / sequence_SO=supercontig / SO=protein_coding / is_pseudo=false